MRSEVVISTTSKLCGLESHFSYLPMVGNNNTSYRVVGRLSKILDMEAFLKLRSDMLCKC